MVTQLPLRLEVHLGSNSHKISKITIFGHKHFLSNNIINKFSTKCDRKMLNSQFFLKILLFGFYFSSPKLTPKSSQENLSSQNSTQPQSLLPTISGMMVGASQPTSLPPFMLNKNNNKYATLPTK